MKKVVLGLQAGYHRHRGVIHMRNYLSHILWPYPPLCLTLAAYAIPPRRAVNKYTVA